MKPALVGDQTWALESKLVHVTGRRHDSVAGEMVAVPDEGDDAMAEGIPTDPLDVPPHAERTARRPATVQNLAIPRRTLFTPLASALRHWSGYAAWTKSEVTRLFKRESLPARYRLARPGEAFRVRFRRRYAAKSSSSSISSSVRSSRSRRGQPCQSRSSFGNSFGIDQPAR